MTYQEIYYQRQSNGAIVQRTTVALVKSVRAILLEDPGTPNHAVRVGWAKAVNADPDGAANTVAWGVLTDPGVIAAGEAVTDAQLQTVVDALVTALVGG